MSVYFIGGSQRSGTSLLHLVLCQDKTTNPYIREASYFKQLMDAYRHGKEQLPNNTQHYFDSIDELRGFHARIVKMFIEHMYNRYAGCKNLVLKSPHLTMLFPDVFELYEDVYFVCIARDPRDIVASMVEVGLKLQQEGKANIYPRNNIRGICAHIQSFYSPTITTLNRNKAFSNRTYFIRYEDLVLTPDVCLEKLAGFTGLQLNTVTSGQEYDSNLVDFDKQESHYTSWSTALTGKPISPESLGRHKKELTDQEIRTIEEECNGLMKAFGYGANIT